MIVGSCNTLSVGRSSVALAAVRLLGVRSLVALVVSTAVRFFGVGDGRVPFPNFVFTRARAAIASWSASSLTSAACSVSEMVAC